MHSAFRSIAMVGFVFPLVACETGSNFATTVGSLPDRVILGTELSDATPSAPKRKEFLAAAREITLAKGVSTAIDGGKSLAEISARLGITPSTETSLVLGFLDGLNKAIKEDTERMTNLRTLYDNLYASRKQDVRDITAAANKGELDAEEAKAQIAAIRALIEEDTKQAEATLGKFKARRQDFQKARQKAVEEAKTDEEKAETRVVRNNIQTNIRTYQKADTTVKNKKKRIATSDDFSDSKVKLTIIWPPRSSPV